MYNKYGIEMSPDTTFKENTICMIRFKNLRITMDKLSWVF